RATGDLAAPRLLAHERVEDRVDVLAERPLPRNEVRQHVAPQAQALEAVLDEQVLLAVEVEVERPLRDVRRGADRVDGGGVDPALEEEAIGRLADRRPRPLAPRRGAPRRRPGGPA